MSHRVIAKIILEKDYAEKGHAEADKAMLEQQIARMRELMPVSMRVKYLVKTEEVK